MDFYVRNKAAIEEYLKSGEKSGNELYLGLEFEHIITEKKSYKSISYFEKNGVEQILKDLKDFGWEVVTEKGKVLSAKKGRDNITLEPGGQFELSTDKSQDLVEIESCYLGFIKDMRQIMKKRDRDMLAIGYHPVSKIEDMDYIPKERYGFMSDYLSRKDKCGINMMKGTASIQATIDYVDENDFIKKFRAANFLTVLFSILFDNSPVFEGKIWDGNLARVHIWNNVDEDRSRVMPGALDKRFGYDDYAEYVMGKPLVISLIDDKMTYTKDVPMREVYKDRDIKAAEIEHALSMFFPDVRVKKYIELRMCDSVPYPYNLSVGALVKGIFYDDENLNYYFERSLEATDESVQSLKDKVIGSKDIPIEVLDEIKDLLKRAKDGLSEEEKRFIDPLIEMFEKNINIAKLVKSQLKARGTESFEIVSALKNQLD